MRRVASRVVVCQWDNTRTGDFWLVRDYLPEFLSAARARPTLAEQAATIGATITPVPIPWDCHDGFFHSYWQRPEAYPHQPVRRGTSVWAAVGTQAERRAVTALSQDLASRAWHERNRELLKLDEADLGAACSSPERTPTEKRAVLPLPARAPLRRPRGCGVSAFRFCSRHLRERQRDLGPPATRLVVRQAVPPRAAWLGVKQTIRCRTVGSAEAAGAPRRTVRPSPDELINGEESSTIRRQLTNGTAYRAVKVAHTPADLQNRLQSLGWQINVTQPNFGRPRSARRLRRGVAVKQRDPDGSLRLVGDFVHGVGAAAAAAAQRQQPRVLWPPRRVAVRPHPIVPRPATAPRRRIQ